MRIIGNVFRRSGRGRKANDITRPSQPVDTAVVVAVGSDGEITAPLEMPFSLPCDTIVVDPTAYLAEERSAPRLAKGSDNLPAPISCDPKLVR